MRVPFRTKRDTVMPLVSIIVPVYNVEDYLIQCLVSIQDQTLKNIEIICVDDGSTDGSGAILDAFAAMDNRFIVRHKKNGGYGKAVNAGLKLAHGQYIGIVESDDFIAPNMYETLYEAAQKTFFPDIVKGSYWRVVNADTDEEQLLPSNYFNQLDAGSSFTLAENAEFLFHHPSIWSAIYNHDFLKENGIKMPEIPGAGWADNPFMMETLVAARSIVYVNEGLYYYREFNSGSSSVSMAPETIYGRWLDMDNILKARQVTDPNILEGHYCRGCAYVQMLGDHEDFEDLQLQLGMKRILDRLDEEVVLNSENIIWPYKKAYYDFRYMREWPPILEDDHSVRGYLRRAKRKAKHLLGKFSHAE